MTTHPYLVRGHRGVPGGVLVVLVVIIVRRTSVSHPLHRLTSGRAPRQLLVVRLVAMMSVGVAHLVVLRVLVVLWLHRALQLLLRVGSATGRSVHQSNGCQLVLLVLDVREASGGGRSQRRSRAV